MSGRLTPLRFEILPATSTVGDGRVPPSPLHAQPQLAVVDEDRVAGLEGGEDLGMGQVHALAVAERLVGVEDEGLAVA